MVPKTSNGLIAGPQPNDFEIRKLIVNLANAYVRLAKRDRRKVMRALEKFAFGKSRTLSYWDRLSEGDLKCCYLQLQPISKKMANESILKKSLSDICRLCLEGEQPL